jgi:Protein kinase domain
MTLSSGTRLGPYEITSQIGAGGMGEVYKARDTRLDCIVAIKILPAHVASDPDLKQRFEREGKMLASLSHPHICPMFDVGSQDAIDFLATPSTIAGLHRACADQGRASVDSPLLKGSKPRRDGTRTLEIKCHAE